MATGISCHVLQMTSLLSLHFSLETLEEATDMHRKELKRKPSRDGEPKQKNFDHRMETQDYRFRIQRIRRGDGTQSSPLTSRHLATPPPNLRSLSEGDLLATQIIDLTNPQETVEDRQEKTLQLPKLQRKSSTKLVPDHESDQKKSTKTVTQISSGDNDMTAKRFAILRYHEHKRKLKQHIAKEEQQYQVGQTKRDNLVKWLSEQNISEKRM